jgi:hypothetical protein
MIIPVVGIRVRKRIRGGGGFGFRLSFSSPSSVSSVFPLGQSSDVKVGVTKSQ